MRRTLLALATLALVGVGLPATASACHKRSCRHERPACEPVVHCAPAPVVVACPRPEPVCYEPAPCATKEKKRGCGLFKGLFAKKRRGCEPAPEPCREVVVVAYRAPAPVQYYTYSYAPSPQSGAVAPAAQAPSKNLPTHGAPSKQTPPPVDKAAPMPQTPAPQTPAG